MYDATPYLNDHPGGAESILITAGADATDEFNAIHRWVGGENVCVHVFCACVIGVLGACTREGTFCGARISGRRV